MSYIADFYKSPVHKYNDYFVDGATPEEIEKSRRKVNQLRKKLEEAQNEYAIRVNTNYSADFTPTEIPIVLVYYGRNNDLWFDGLTGNALCEPEDNMEKIEYRLENKSGKITVLVGYCFPLGAVICRSYKYNIPTNNLKVNLSLQKEVIIPMLEGDTIYEYYLDSKVLKDIVITNKYTLKNKYLSDTNATEFIQKMYGKTNKYTITLSEMYVDIRANKSFELLLDIPDTTFCQYMLSKTYMVTKPLYKLYDITIEMYNKLVAENRLDAFIKLVDRYEGYNKDCKIITKTNMEWADYTIKSKPWQEAIEFYGIKLSHCNDISSELVDAYCEVGYGYSSYKGSEINYELYYKFGKFCKYIVDETIAQGFNSIQKYMSELRDYISICKQYGVIPTLFTSNLHKVHDIIVRNHNITFNAEQEKEFAKKYDGFKDTIIDKYIIICPKNPKDVQIEGDQLNSCIGFYIKKVLDDICKVYFLRLKSAPSESLISFEVRDGAIVQAEGILHRDPTDEEKGILKKYAESNGLAMAI